MYHRIRTSASLSGLMLWSMTACASTSSLLLDTAKSHRPEAYQTAIGHLAKCQMPEVEIAYAFGHVRLRSHQANGVCRITLVISGELSEQAEPLTFDCAASAVIAIDWYRDKGVVREQAPIDVIRADPRCLMHGA